MAMADTMAYSADMHLGMGCAFRHLRSSLVLEKPRSGKFHISNDLLLAEPCITPPDCPKYITVTTEGVSLAVHGTPMSRECGIFVTEEVLEVEVDLPAKKGVANQGILLMLSNVLEIDKSQIVILTGGKSRDKVIAVQGVSYKDVHAKLTAASRPIVGPAEETTPNAPTATA